MNASSIFKLPLSSLLATIPLTLLLFGCGSNPSESDEWKSLFNGSDLSGWELKSDEASAIWTVIDGVIDCQPDRNIPGDKHLWTTASYKDFQLKLEWRLKELKGLYNMPTILPDGSYVLDDQGKRVTKPTPNADSGVLLRGLPKAQVNIWAWPIGSGEVYGYRHNQKDPVVRAGVTPKVNADKPIGEWNQFTITMQGDRLTVELNGQLVLDQAQLPGVPEEGPIALQHHGGYDKIKDVWNGASSLVQFRNISIKEL